MSRIPTIEYRVLGHDDFARVSELNLMFGRAFDDHVSYESKPPSDRYLRSLLAEQSVIVLVAIHRDIIVGGLVAYELPKLEQERSEIYIFDLAVDENYRRQGIATRLIESLRSLAAARGAWVIYVQADFGDSPAIALYEKLGRREEVLHFDIPVLVSRR